MADLTLVEVHDELKKEWPNRNFGVTQTNIAIKIVLEEIGKEDVDLGTLPTNCPMFINSGNAEVLHMVKTVVRSRLKEL